MRVAIISDIQGNAVALEAVLAQIKMEAVDQIVCLGDVATGFEPERVLDLLEENAVLCVRGNMDEVVLNPQPDDGNDANAQRYAEIDAWCHQQLGAKHRQMIADFTLTTTIQLTEATRLMCFHGAPADTQAVIDAETPIQQLDVYFSDADAQIFATGHMHTPMLRHYKHAQIINPGSVGLPFGGKIARMPLYAEYGLIDAEKHSVRLTFMRVTYAKEIFRHRLLHSGMPHAGWYLQQWQVD